MTPSHPHHPIAALHPLQRYASHLTNLLFAFFLITAACNTTTTPPVPPTPPTPQLQTITILRPDGSPAAGSLIALIPQGQWARVQNGQLENDSAYTRFTADPHGQIPLPFDPPPWIAVAIDPIGFAQISRPDLFSTRKIQLQSWSRVNGQMLVATHPAVNAEIVAVIDSPLNQPAGPGVVALGQAFTDSTGHFDMDRVPPGKLCVDREFYGIVNNVTLWAGMAQRAYLTAQPGQTYTVNLSGSGRPIVGEVQIPPDLKSRTDWQFSRCSAITHIPKPQPPMPADIQNASPDAQAKWYADFLSTPQGADFLQKQQNVEYQKQQYPGSITPDGRFRIEDVPSGDYSIIIEAVTGVGGSEKPTGHVIADAEQIFHVPPLSNSRSDDPFTIPPVPLELLPTAPNIGDPAPNFAVTTLDGRRLTLADFRGKYLLLDFWATWSGPCLASIPKLQSLHAQTANNSNFAMLSLSVDESAYEAKRFTDQQKIDWPQAWIGPDSKIEKNYAANTEGIPTFWIIDPTGKIAAHPKYDSDLEQSVNAIIPK